MEVQFFKRRKSGILDAARFACFVKKKKSLCTITHNRLKGNEHCVRFNTQAAARVSPPFQPHPENGLRYCEVPRRQR